MTIQKTTKKTNSKNGTTTLKKKLKHRIVQEQQYRANLSYHLEHTAQVMALVVM